MLPSLSDALAASEIVAGALNALPVAGLVKLTVGGLFGAPTVIETGADVVTADLLSVARALNVYDPGATPRLVDVTHDGQVIDIDLPTELPPRKPILSGQKK